MIKTSTLPLKKSSQKTKKTEVFSANRDENGPSEASIQNILNYSKALQVIHTEAAETVFGVMN